MKRSSWQRYAVAMVQASGGLLYEAGGNVITKTPDLFVHEVVEVALKLAAAEAAGTWEPEEPNRRTVELPERSHVRLLVPAWCAKGRAFAAVGCTWLIFAVNEGRTACAVRQISTGETEPIQVFEGVSFLAAFPRGVPPRRSRRPDRRRGVGDGAAEGTAERAGRRVRRGG